MKSKAWGQHLHFGWAASAGHNPEVRKLQGPAAVTWKLGSPLCRVSGQDTTKSKMGRRKDLLLTESKENLLAVGSFPKQCLPEYLNWGSCKLRVHAYS